MKKLLATLLIASFVVVTLCAVTTQNSDTVKYKVEAGQSFAARWFASKPDYATTVPTLETFKADSINGTNDNGTTETEIEAAVTVASSDPKVLYFGIWTNTPCSYTITVGPFANSTDSSITYPLYGMLDSATSWTPVKTSTTLTTYNITSVKEAMVKTGKVSLYWDLSSATAGTYLAPLSITVSAT